MLPLHIYCPLHLFHKILFHVHEQSRRKKQIKLMIKYENNFNIILSDQFNSILANIPIFYPLKTPENRFSGV